MNRTLGNHITQINLKNNNVVYENFVKDLTQKAFRRYNHVINSAEILGFNNGVPENYNGELDHMKLEFYKPIADKVIKEIYRDIL